MSEWQDHVRETRARTMGSLGAVYKKPDSVYNNSTMNARFKPGEGVFQCRICTRQTRDVNGSNGSLELCYECEEASMAENTLSDSAEMTAEERASIQAYIWQMNRAAVAKGGTLPASALGPQDDAQAEEGEEGEPAAERAQLKRGRPRLQKRLKSDRPRGRPVVTDEARLIPITMRMTSVDRDKLQALGRDWLVKSIRRAKLPEAPTE